MLSIYEKLIALTEEEEEILDQAKSNVNKTVYTNQQDFVIERAKFLPDNKLIVIRKHPRYIAFPTHRHDYIELNYVYHGKLKQKVGQEWIELQKGELLFLNQHIEHELEPCGDEDLIINFIIDPKFFDHMFQNLDIEGAEQSIINFLISGLFNHDRAGHYLYFRVSKEREIQEIISKMILEMMQPSIFSEVTMKFQMGLLMVQLMEHADKAITRSNHLYDHRIVVEVLDYINDSYKTASLEHMANHLQMASYNLSKQIKKSTGKTFKEILQERRLEEAKILLNHTDISIDQIAEDIGYENISYFYRIFKKRYGCTPRVFRTKD